ncbi:MAG: type II secretion system protein GspK [Pirellulaceae bacterium]
MNKLTRRRGFVLIVVLIVVVLLSLGAYSFSDLMITHQESAQLCGTQLQTRLLVDSGVDFAKAFFAKNEATRTDAGGIFENPDMFRARTVMDDENPELRGSFTILSPNLDDEGNLGGVRYGFEDESTRLNLSTIMTLENTLPGSGQSLLMALPEMTEEVADAILDWLDEDDEARELGAEVSYYSGLSPPYAPKNGPLETVEELLLVRGVTPQLLFGMDTNRNGMIDPHEASGDGKAGQSTSAGVSERGWSAYLTLFSLEANLNAMSEKRVFLNVEDMTQLNTELTDAGLNAEWATFIVAYRQSGPYTGTNQAQLGVTGELDLTKKGATKINQLLDLIGAKVQVTFKGSSTPTVIDSPFSKEIGAMGLYLPVMMDKLTINEATTIPGRININQASVTILKGIPGMTEEIANEILSRREYEPSDEKLNHRHETWIMAEAIVTLDEMRSLMPYICGGGDVYRAQVVGYFQGGQAASRAEVIFDASTTTPRVLLWRDTSHLGRGFALETLGVDFSESSGSK